MTTTTFMLFILVLSLIISPLLHKHIFSKMKGYDNFRRNMKIPLIILTVILFLISYRLLFF